MKNMISISKKVLAIILLFICAITGFAEDRRFAFNADQTTELANFMKQTSAIEGKCNAEVLGIDVAREGFSWDDINTWLNSKGEIWNTYSATYATTKFGFGFKTEAPYKGGISWISLCISEEDDKWNPAIQAVVNLKGVFTLTDCNAETIKITGSGMDTLKIKATNATKDCYLTAKQNRALKQFDFSGSTGKLRQAEISGNAFTDKTAILCNDCPKTNFLDGLFDVKDNLYTFSTLPKHPIKGTILGKGSYENQWVTAGGMPIGTRNASAEYEVKEYTKIDLSKEFTIEGKNTLFTWKDESDQVITPTSVEKGIFTFGNEFVGKTIKCELSNETYPLLIIKTVVAKVISDPTVNIKNETTDLITIYPSLVTDFIYVNGYQKGNIEIKIISLSGKLAMKVQNVTELNLSTLASGIYMVQIINEDHLSIQKIIKK